MRSPATSSAFAQNQNTNTTEGQQRKVTTTAKPADPKISAEDRERALRLLDLSEAQARSFEAPLRSYMLYQIAQSYLQVDKTNSSGLFRDAFTSTLEIRDDDDLKQRLQDAILTGLLPLSQEEAEELLPQAEPQARKRASVAIAQKYLSDKRFDRAIALVTQMSSWTELPYDIASQIMAALPEEMDGDFRTLFAQVFSSFQSHSHKAILQSGGDFCALVAKFGNRLPPSITLDAIDEVLKQAKEHDNASISVSAEGGTASFASLYEYQLFQLFPLIKKLDEGHAKALLDQNTLVKSMAQQYPNGVQSLDPGSADTGKPNANGGNAREVKPVRRGMSVSISGGWQ